MICFLSENENDVFPFRTKKAKLRKKEIIFLWLLLWISINILSD